MELLQKDNDKLLIQTTVDDINILKNALNEVCHALDNFDFETRMGYTQIEVEKLLKQILIVIRQSRQTEIKSATKLDDRWICCPYCTNVSEISSQNSIIMTCPTCNQDFYNPLYKKENADKK